MSTYDAPALHTADLTPWADNPDYWAARTDQWVARLHAETNPYQPAVMAETLNDAATLAQAGREDLAGLVLAAWTAAVTRATTRAAS